MENRTRMARIQMLWPVAVVSSCFLLGGILGSLFAVTVTGDSAGQLQEYLADYMSLAKEGTAERSVLGAFWNQGRWFLVCAFLGLTGCGLAVLPVLFVMRGFLFAFGVACFVRFLGVSGLVPAGVVFGIPALLWMPGLFLCGILGLAAGCRAARIKAEAPATVQGMSRNHRAGILLSVLLFLLCVFMECSLLPVLLPLAARILG